MWHTEKVIRIITVSALGILPITTLMASPERVDQTPSVEFSLPDMPKDRETVRKKISELQQLDVIVLLTEHSRELRALLPALEPQVFSLTSVIDSETQLRLAELVSVYLRHTDSSSLYSLRQDWERIGRQAGARDSLEQVTSKILSRGTSSDLRARQAKELSDLLNEVQTTREFNDKIALENSLSRLERFDVEDLIHQGTDQLSRLLPALDGRFFGIKIDLGSLDRLLKLVEIHMKHTDATSVHSLELDWRRLHSRAFGKLSSDTLNGQIQLLISKRPISNSRRCIMNFEGR